MSYRLHEMVEVPLDDRVDAVHPGEGRGKPRPAPPAGRGHPPQPYREDQLEDETQPEDRNDPYDRPPDANRDVDPSVPLRTRDDPSDHAHERGDQHGADPDLDRGGGPFRGLPPDGGGAGRGGG